MREDNDALRFAYHGRDITRCLDRIHVRDMKKLDAGDITAISLDLGVEEPVIRAVIDVESSGSGFIDDKPKILFERHIFWKRLLAHGFDPTKLMQGNEDVLGPDWDRQYYVGGLGEYDRLEKATKIDLTSALESASWGLFQILGYHWKSLGYQSVQEFVNKMNEGEFEQLKAFALFVAKNHLIQSLRDKDWKEFARGYNGSGYAANKYDEKLEKAYKRYAVQ